MRMDLLYINESAIRQYLFEKSKSGAQYPKMIYKKAARKKTARTKAFFILEGAACRSAAQTLYFS